MYVIYVCVCKVCAMSCRQQHRRVETRACVAAGVILATFLPSRALALHSVLLHRRMPLAPMLLGEFLALPYVSIRQHAQHTSAYVCCIRQHTSAYVSIRQHAQYTSACAAYVGIRMLHSQLFCVGCCTFVLVKQVNCVPARGGRCGYTATGQ